MSLLLLRSLNSLPPPLRTIKPAVVRKLFHAIAAADAAANALDRWDELSICVQPAKRRAVSSLGEAGGHVGLASLCGSSCRWITSFVAFARRVRMPPISSALMRVVPAVPGRRHSLRDRVRRARCRGARCSRLLARSTLTPSLAVRVCRLARRDVVTRSMFAFADSLAFVILTTSARERPCVELAFARPHRGAPGARSPRARQRRETRRSSLEERRERAQIGAARERLSSLGAARDNPRRRNLRLPGPPTAIISYVIWPQ
jgi:hypothetical protein